MTDTLFLSLGILFIALAVLSALLPAPKSIVDQEPDMDWSEYYKDMDECPHHHITDVVEEAFANYELVGTYCMDCGDRLEGRQDGY